MGYQFARTAFALAALRRDAQLELDVAEVHARSGMPRDFAIGYFVADTDDHGLNGWAGERWVQYKCESVAFAIILIA